MTEPKDLWGIYTELPRDVHKMPRKIGDTLIVELRADGDAVLTLSQTPAQIIAGTCSVKYGENPENLFSVVDTWQRAQDFTRPTTPKEPLTVNEIPEDPTGQLTLKLLSKQLPAGITGKYDEQIEASGERRPYLVVTTKYGDMIRFQYTEPMPGTSYYFVSNDQNDQSLGRLTNLEEVQRAIEGYTKPRTLEHIDMDFRNNPPTAAEGGYRPKPIPTLFVQYNGVQMIIQEVKTPDVNFAITRTDRQLAKTVKTIEDVIGELDAFLPPRTTLNTAVNPTAAAAEAADAPTSLMDIYKNLPWGVRKNGECELKNGFWVLEVAGFGGQKTLHVEQKEKGGPMYDIYIGNTFKPSQTCDLRGVAEAVEKAIVPPRLKALFLNVSGAGAGGTVKFEEGNWQNGKPDVLYVQGAKGAVTVEQMEPDVFLVNDGTQEMSIKVDGRTAQNKVRAVLRR